MKTITIIIYNIVWVIFWGSIAKDPTKDNFWKPMLQMSIMWSIPLYTFFKFI